MPFTPAVGRTLVIVSILFGLAGFARAQEFDLVLLHGRIIDPASQTDAIRHIGIRGDAIAAVSTEPLSGRTVIDARGLAIAPGFIDLHQHAMDPEDLWLKAQDGYTTACEIEVGTADVEKWYRAREGRSPIHFGVSIGHIPSRMALMGDRPSFVPAAGSASATSHLGEARLQELLAQMERGLQAGAVAVGFGLQYTPGANQWEVLEVFRLAERYRASCHLHMRAKGETGAENVFSALKELIAATAITGAPSHVCHVQSTGNQNTPRMLQIISEARDRGIDISVEAYPYTAGMTDIRSAIFDPGFLERTNVTYADMQWAATGERLTEETFAKYRATGGMVIVHSNPEDLISDTVAHPLTMIASDGLRGHPRHAGTGARILGRYVREQQRLSLLQAVDKLSLMPAQRLEARVPGMKNKGRISVGADADLVVFDPATVIDRATYTSADLPSEGIRHVLVSGVFVVRDGELQDARPGRAVRGPLGRPGID